MASSQENPDRLAVVTLHWKRGGDLVDAYRHKHQGAHIQTLAHLHIYIGVHQLVFRKAQVLNI